MTIHKEGAATISITALFVGALNIANFSYLYPISATAAWLVFILTVAFFLFIVSFFRMPNRKITLSDSAIIAPADGKVVVIEEAARAVVAPQVVTVQLGIVVSVPPSAV